MRLHLLAERDARARKRSGRRPRQYFRRLVLCHAERADSKYSCIIQMVRPKGHFIYGAFSTLVFLSDFLNRGMYHISHFEIHLPSNVIYSWRLCHRSRAFHVECWAIAIWLFGGCLIIDAPSHLVPFHFCHMLFYLWKSALATSLKLESIDLCWTLEVGIKSGRKWFWLTGECRLYLSRTVLLAPISSSSNQIYELALLYRMVHHWHWSVSMWIELPVYEDWSGPCPSALCV